MRRWWQRGAAAGAPRWISRAFISGGVAALLAGGLLATIHSTRAAACDTSWIVANGNGDWSTATDWTAGVPTSASNACLPTGAYTVSITGESVHANTLDIESGVTLFLQDTGCGPVSAALTMGGNLTNLGTINLGNPGDACGGTAQIVMSSGSILLNTGTILTSGGRGDRQLTGSVTNQGTVAVNFTNGTILHLDGAGVFDNQGSMTIADGMTVRIPGGTGLEFRNDAGGSITGNGTGGQLIMDGGNTFTQGAGTTSGNPAVLTGGATLHFTGAGASTIDLRGDGGSNLLSGGPIAAGQTVNVQEHGCSPVSSVANLAASLTNAGTINLSNLDDACGGTAQVVVPTGATLTNTGTILTSGGRGDRQLTGSVTNQGMIKVNFTNGTILHLDGAGVFENQGSVTIADGMTVRIPGGTGLEFRNDAGGSVTGNGTSGQLIMDGGNTFTQGAGTTIGNPPLLTGGATLHFTGAGASTIDLRGDGGANTLSGGAIAAGQTVNVQEHGCSPVSSVANLAGNLTNAGTIDLANLDDACGGTAQVVIPTGSTLTNTGTILTSAGRGDRQLTGSVTNQGTITVNPTSGNGLHLDGSGLFDNFGSVSVASGMTLTNTNDQLIAEPGGTFGGAGAYVLGSAGTFGVTVDGTHNTNTSINCGGTASVAGALRVKTIGAPGVGSSWPIIVCGSRVGVFATFDFESFNYTVQYPSNGVTLTAQGSCDTWVGGTDNNFGTAQNWSFGHVPGSGDDACITSTTGSTLPTPTDTYTVIVNGNTFSVHSLTLGGSTGTQTLSLPGASMLSLLSGSSVNSRGVITIGSGAIFNIADMTNAGTITLGDSSNAAADLGCSGACSGTGPTLTNAGRLQTIAGSTAIRRLKPIIVNAASSTVDLAGNVAKTDGGCRGGGIADTRGITNNGTVTVESGANLAESCGFWNSAGGTLVNNGTVDMGGDEFVQRGTETGNPVIFQNGSGLDPDLTSGPGSFLYNEPSGGIHPSGAHPGIASGDTVTIASGVTVGISPQITNAGTLILGDISGAGDSALCCDYYTAPATITNTGTIRTVPIGTEVRHIQVNVTNAGGTVDIGADTRQDSNAGNVSCGPNGVNANLLTNNGMFLIQTNAHYTLGACPAGSQHQNTFTQGQFGTLQTAIVANPATWGELVSSAGNAGDLPGVVNLAGLLRVGTVGSPTVGSKFPIVLSSVMNGQFSSLDFGGEPYAWVYAPSPGPLGVLPGFTMIRTNRVNPCASVPQAWHCQPIGRTPSPAPSGPWWNRGH